MYTLKFLEYIADSESCSLIVGTDDILGRLSSYMCVPWLIHTRNS